MVLREDTLAPMRWPMARIVKTHAGADGLVRVVTLKTSSGTYTRPTSKVALLPLTLTLELIVRTLNSLIYLLL